MMGKKCESAIENDTPCSRRILKKKKKLKSQLYDFSQQNDWMFAMRKDPRAGKRLTSDLTSGAVDIVYILSAHK